MVSVPHGPRIVSETPAQRGASTARDQLPPAKPDQLPEQHGGPSLASPRPGAEAKAVGVQCGQRGSPRTSSRTANSSDAVGSALKPPSDTPPGGSRRGEIPRPAITGISQLRTHPQKFRRGQQTHRADPPCRLKGMKHVAPEAQKVIDQLNAELAANGKARGVTLSWSPRELELLDQLADTITRRCQIAKLYDKALTDADEPKLVIALSQEERQLRRAAVVLMNDLETDVPEPESTTTAKARMAANQRWQRVREQEEGRAAN